MSASDIRFSVAVAVIGSILAFVAVWFGGAYGTLVIILVPIAFLFRSQQRGGRDKTTVEPNKKGDPE